MHDPTMFLIIMKLKEQVNSMLAMSM